MGALRADAIGCWRTSTGPEAAGGARTRSLTIRSLRLLPGLVLTVTWLAGLPAQAQPEGFTGAVAKETWTPLLTPGRGTPKPLPIPNSSKLLSIEELQFIGPEPGHPFVLGQFAVDGRFGLVNGGLQLIDGKNAAVQLAWGDQFELEGIMEQAEVGGWFLLFGWDQGRGYSVCNVTLRDSGSPWFVSEYRGNQAISDRTQEFQKFDWRREQPFKVTVRENELTFEVGRFKVIDGHPLPAYSPGAIILGVYDTRYGPKPIRVKSLRIRSLASP